MVWYRLVNFTHITKFDSDNDVLLYEKRRYIGGRIYTTKVAELKKRIVVISSRVTNNFTYYLRSWI